jgi:hypothetical protein
MCGARQGNRRLDVRMAAVGFLLAAGAFADPGAKKRRGTT